MSEELKAAQARIACLEGEIAKRDEELAARRVAVENCDLFRARIAELEARIVWLECEAQVNAAPVSEAKAQGVVMPPSPYMPGSQPTDFTDYELGEIHGRIAMWEEVKHLNSAPVQQVRVPDELARAFITGESCDGVYRVVIQFETLKEMQAVHSWLARLNAAPVQQVSVPTHKMILAGEEQWERSGNEAPDVAAIFRAMLAAAPAAPAADASDVLEQAMYTLISIGYHENSGLVHELRQALAAHRAKGVV